MIGFIGFLVRMILVAINMPYALDGRALSIASASFCGGIGVACLAIGFFTMGE